jgi:hypothetical protein
VKYYLKLNKKVLRFNSLKEAVKKAIKNYFNNAYNKDIYKNYVKKIKEL